MKNIKKMMPYLLVNIMVFYLLPFLIQDTGSAMFVLLIGIPICCFIISFIYGIKNSFQWQYGLIVMALFVPTIFIFYNESAVVYIAVYGVISLIGNFLGSKFFKEKV